MKIRLSPKILDLTKFLKIFKKKDFCLESFSGHFKKKLFFRPTEKFSTLSFCCWKFGQVSGFLTSPKISQVAAKYPCWRKGYCCRPHQLNFLLKLMQFILFGAELMLTSVGSKENLLQSPRAWQLKKSILCQNWLSPKNCDLVKFSTTKIYIF